MLSHRNKGPAVPRPWASPRGQARGGGTRSRGRGRSGARPGPQGRPGSTPGHRAGLHTAGREARESAPRIRVRAALSPPSPGPLSGAPRVPPFLGSWGTSPAPATSPPGSFSFQPERVPPPPPGPHAHHRAFGWTREKQRRVETRGGAPRAPGGPELRLARRPVARRREETRGAAVPGLGQCLTCGEAAEEEGEGRPESQGWTSCPSPHTHPSSSACYH